MSEPAEGTVERWAWDFIRATALDAKLAPPEPTERFENGPARRVTPPGRPPELRVAAKAKKTRGLGSKEGRARALHAFLHHELQAAELMAWAVLAFPQTPAEFRAGLVRIARDEIRHMRIYAEQIERLGFHVGDFEVRDWFWERVPTAKTPASFVAVMGLGLESANLEHAATFAAKFRAAGDEEGARAQEIVGREEIAHVRFGVRWFETFAAPLEFDAWRRALPEPLTPLLMRGLPLERSARRKAGQPERFIDELEAWQPASPGC
ncbi:MAG TPA: DUF455 family protein [Polyangiaceae bacterium]|jgi:uncharacterized ferritin-like protein (DUF455 family)